MKQKIIITMLGAVVILLAWPQVKQYRDQQKFQAWADAEQVKKAKEQREFMKMICQNLPEQMSLYRQDPSLYVMPSFERQEKCKDWK